MADSEVNILVNVITKGQETLQKTQKDLKDLEKNVAKAADTTQKSDKVEKAKNKTLGDQIPVLKELSPILSKIGLGWAAGATAIAAVGYGAMMASQSFQTWVHSMIDLAAQTNTLTGAQGTYNESTDEADKHANALQITMKDYSSSMIALDGVTRSNATSLGILTEATKIHKDTGISLETVVNNLAGAYDGTIAVYDEMGNRIPAGVEAVKKMESQLDATKNATNGLRSSTDDSFHLITETVGKSVGNVVTELKRAAEQVAIDAWILLGIGEDGWLVKGIGNVILWFEKIDWSGIWNGIGAEWSKFWNGLWTDIQKIWGTISSWFSGIDWSSIWEGVRTAWDSVWSNLGADWSKLWRGAVNLAIVDPLNALITLLDKIQVAIPSVDILGWHTPAVNFGVNIPQIPQLAEGGNILGAGSALVGENGPELLNLPRGAQVSPLGGQTGPVTIQVYVGDAQLAQFVIDKLDRDVRLRGGY